MRNDLYKHLKEVSWIDFKEKLDLLRPRQEGAMSKRKGEAGAYFPQERRGRASDVINEI